MFTTAIRAKRAITDKISENVPSVPWFRVWERSGGFLPLWPYPSFEVSTVAFRLGRWTAKIAVAPDTEVIIPQICSIAGIKPEIRDLQLGERKYLEGMISGESGVV